MDDLKLLSLEGRFNPILAHFNTPCGVLFYPLLVIFHNE